MDWTKVGNIEIGRVLESNGPFMRIYDFFPDATPENLAPHRDWLHRGALTLETDMLIMPIQSYIVRTPRSTVLVDSCVGNHKSVKWFPSWDHKDDDAYLRGFASLGIHPDEIDVVLCTHLHVDHCGWNTQLIDGRWVPTFKNARYVLSRIECENSERLARDYGDPTYAENVQPLLEAGQAVLVDDDHELDEFVRLEPTPGHTPGHCAIHLASRGDSAVVTGDLIHSPIQCHFPHWNFKFDANKERAAKTRLDFLTRYSDCDTRVLTAHFPLPSTGHIRRYHDVFEFLYDDS
jgi:glyoxylase-like metal-dependent hydrolase (beta-lactamase superfamily II)